MLIITSFTKPYQNQQKFCSIKNQLTLRTLFPLKKKRKSKIDHNLQDQARPVSLQELSLHFQHPAKLLINSKQSHKIKFTCKSKCISILLYSAYIELPSRSWPASALDTNKGIDQLIFFPCESQLLLVSEWRLSNKTICTILGAIRELWRAESKSWSTEWWWACAKMEVNICYMKFKSHFREQLYFFLQVLDNFW